MRNEPDDVDFGVSPSQATSLHEIYREVRAASMLIASAEPDVLIDLGENSDGMPQADIYRDGSLVRRVFATFD